MEGDLRNLRQKFELSENLMNFLLGVLDERHQLGSPKPQYIFPTTFYKKLVARDLESLKQYTSNLDAQQLFQEIEFFIIPVFHPSDQTFTLHLIDFKSRLI